MKTEQEAAKLLCPHMKYNVSPYRGDTGWVPEYEHTRCQGAMCMAWRWGKDPDSYMEQSRILVKTNEPWTCECCKGEGKSAVTAQEAYESAVGLIEGEILACPECDGKGKGFKFAPAGYCGLAGVP
jgi:hypothetical protein